MAINPLQGNSSPCLWDDRFSKETCLPSDRSRLGLPVMSHGVFLFGAGASKGATHVRPCHPPLMRELYDELVEYNPREWGVLSDCADRFREDFETTFCEKILKIGRYGPDRADTLTLLEKQRSLALYFSQFFLDTSNLDYYSRLLASLSGAGLISDCFFGSLNYDYLFEQAGHRLGLPVDYLCSESKSMRITKLHGSCNFTAKISRLDRAQLATTGTHYEIPFDIDLDPETVKEKLSSPDHFPVMSQVSPSKEDFLAAGGIHEMRKVWAQALSNAGFLAVIGVSCNQNDAHVIEPIRSATAQIGYIGGESDFQKWKAINKNFIHVGKTFEEGFDKIIRLAGIK
jgi:hypothetical protein